MGATGGDVRVKLSAEGVAEVVAALRRVDKEAAEASAKAREQARAQEQAQRAAAQAAQQAARNQAAAAREQARAADVAAKAAQRQAREQELSAARGGRAVQFLTTQLADLRTLLPTLGAAAAITGIVRLTSQSIEYGDAIAKASSRTKIAAADISELAYAASTVDVEVGVLTAAIRAMQTTLSEAASGSKSATAALAALGLTVEQLQGLSPDRQFELIADRISQIKDPADQARARLDILGKAGDALAPLMENGAAGIRALREEAQRLGRSLSEDQVRALADADRAVKQLKASFDGLATSLIARVAPSLTKVADDLRVSLLGTELERVQMTIRELENRSSPGFALVPQSAIDRRLAELRQQERRLREAAASRGPRRSLAETRGARPSEGLGYEPAEPKDPKTTTGGRDSIEDDPLFVRVTRPKIVAGEMEEFYRRLDEQTQTSTDRALAGYQEQIAKIEELKRAGQITPEEATERQLAAIDAVLQPIEVTEKRIKEKTQEISEFQREAARGTQQIIADALANGFEGGAKGILSSFGNMLRQLAAQAVAAKLAEKLFGSVGGSGSPGLLNSGGGGILGVIGSLFGYAEGGMVKGPGTGTSDSVVARVSAGEYVMPARVVAQPGVLQLLETMRSLGNPAAVRYSAMPRFAAGGIVPEFRQAAAPLTVQQNFNISTPTGQAPLATQQQIGAEAMRGLMRAQGRNG
jgi:hypothetical protein